MWLDGLYMGAAFYAQYTSISHMELRGRKLTLDVDGERAWEFNEFDAPHGYIGLQAEGKAFDFRNLRVQPVD
jgi:hypothetical protein